MIYKYLCLYSLSLTSSHLTDRQPRKCMPHMFLCDWSMGSPQTSTIFKSVPKCCMCTVLSFLMNALVFLWLCCYELVDFYDIYISSFYVTIMPFGSVKYVLILSCLSGERWEHEFQPWSLFQLCHSMSFLFNISPI